MCYQGQSWECMETCLGNTKQHERLREDRKTTVTACQ